MHALTIRNGVANGVDTELLQSDVMDTSDKVEELTSLVLHMNAEMNDMAEILRVQASSLYSLKLQIKQKNRTPR
jgi:hypothetical protein